MPCRRAGISSNAPQAASRSAAAGCWTRPMRRARGPPPANHDPRQARQDHRRARALLVPGGARPHGQRRRQRAAAHPSGRSPRARGRRAYQEHGRNGDRHGGAVDQPVLVSQGPRHGRSDRQNAEREARRAVRVAAGALRGLRFARAAIPRSRGSAARTRDEEARLEGRRDRRNRGRRGLLGSALRSGLGQGRGARRRPVHPSAEHAAARRPLQGQRLALQHHRQPARYHHRAVAPDL